jgi:chemotaxis protein CheD
MTIDQLPRHFLMPGAIFVNIGGFEVMTVLGSCVAICLWDKRIGAGGINHYMLPLWNGEGLPTPKYGNIAIEQLIRKMMDLGCQKETMVAKVFGGANMLSESSGVYAVGQRNVAFAEQFMQNHGIPIVGSDTGGTSGRRIIFNFGTGVVYLRKK